MLSPSFLVSELQHVVLKDHTGPIWPRLGEVLSEGSICCSIFFLLISPIKKPSLKIGIPDGGDDSVVMTH